MEDILTILMFTAAGAVALSLVMGLVGTLNPDADPKKQNRFMQLRVLFQFIALVLLGISLALK